MTSVNFNYDDDADRNVMNTAWFWQTSDPLATVNQLFHTRATTIMVTGEINMCSENLMRRYLDSAFNNDPVQLIIDLTAVKFFSSSGLAVILDARDRAKAHGIELLLRYSDNGSVARVLNTSGLTEFFTRVHDAHRD